MSKYLLVLRKTSFFLKPRSTTMSLGSNRVCSKAEATWHPMPPLKSLIDASSIRGLTTKHGCWEPSLGPSGLNICPFCSSAGDLVDFLLFRSSLSLLFVSGTRPSSIHYVLAFLLSPPLRISLFGPRGQGWLRSIRGRLRWRRWKLGLSRLPKSPLPGWSSINSIRLFWGFLWMPISSGRLLGDKG